MQAVPTAEVISFHATDHFNLAWNSSAGDNEAATITSLVEQLHLKYPQVTYDEIAFPHCDIGTADIRQGSVAARDPVLRASLNCTLLAQDQFNVTLIVEHEGVPPTAMLSTRVDLPDNCHFGGPGMNLSYTTLSNTIETTGIYLTQASGLYGGILQNLYVGTPIDSEVPESISQMTVFPASCPTLAFTFGYFALDDNMFSAMASGEQAELSLNGSVKANVTDLMCGQNMRSLKADATFNSPSLVINSNQPPVVDESSVQYLSNGTSGVVEFSYRIESTLLSLLATFDTATVCAASDESSEDQDTAPLDPFYQSVISGPDAVLPKELVSPENTGKLFNATNHFYRKHMAQAINADMR